MRWVFGSAEQKNSSEQMKPTDEPLIITFWLLASLKTLSSLRITECAKVRYGLQSVLKCVFHMILFHMSCVCTSYCAQISNQWSTSGTRASHTESRVCVNTRAMGNNKLQDDREPYSILWEPLHMLRNMKRIDNYTRDNYRPTQMWL